MKYAILETNHYDSGFLLDGRNFNEVVKRGVMSEEFVMNQVGERLQEYFPNESDNFTWMFAPVKQIERKVKKKKGKANRKGSASWLGASSFIGEFHWGVARPGAGGRGTTAEVTWFFWDRKKLEEGGQLALKESTTDLVRLHSAVSERSRGHLKASQSRREGVWMSVTSF